MKRALFALAIIALLIPSTSREQTVTLTYTGAPPAGACTSVYTNWSAINGTTGTHWLCDGSSWNQIPPPTMPSGMIAFIDTGSCPSGWTEEAHAGDYTLLTQAANGDVGTTGGSTSYTPAGTVSAPTFTGTPFTSVINHTHTVTVTYNVQGGTTASTSGTHVMTSAATGGSARAPTSGDVVSATTANPSGGVSSITPAGTNSVPSFTGTGATIQPTYLKLIACKKN